jgi:hypothetical protein
MVSDKTNCIVKRSKTGRFSCILIGIFKKAARINPVKLIQIVLAADWDYLCGLK